MRFFTARRLALAALLPALLTVTFIPGCSQQGEGERCGDESGIANNDDCGDGLVCTTIDASRNPPIYRCCYSDGHVTDSRCLKVVGTGGAPGGGGASGAGGANTAGAGTAGANTAGADGSLAGASSEAGAGGV